MTGKLLASSLCCACLGLSAYAGEIAVKSPNGRLCLTVLCPSEGGEATYAVSLDGRPMLLDSPLGLTTDADDFARRIRLASHRQLRIDTLYEQTRIKTRRVHYRATELTCSFVNEKGRPMDIVFRVADNDVAFRYFLPRTEHTFSVRVTKEHTGFRFPSATTTFLTPQSDPMTGWKRTKPSYEEEYTVDAPMDRPSTYRRGYTFPGLFRIGEAGWVLVSETGVDSRYCASRLSEMTEGNLYTVLFPMEEENNGHGSSRPAFTLPGHTPWRTITAGEDLRPITETTVTWDVVSPLYESEHRYRPGRGVWSWILWQDGSINYEDQMHYLRLASAMGYEYLLVDNWWDKNIGYERMAHLVREARDKGVGLFLWYSSGGYWNDIEQSPLGIMDNPIRRKQEMRRLRSLGVKGIKVDFFGGDKQETMRLYEAILSDADDHGLMVVFHGCTLPRGWERMYPNYMGSEAVLASENLIFNQHFCDTEALNATLHPFLRNAVGSMEFGGCFLNKRMNRGNDGGNIRRTTDVFQLATSILYQNPVQFFALAPNNLTDAPPVCLDFLRRVPTEWDEVRFIDGYPGRYVVLARRHDRQWYVAAVNASPEPVTLSLELPMLRGREVSVYADTKTGEPSLKKLRMKDRGPVRLTLRTGGGAVLVSGIDE